VNGDFILTASRESVDTSRKWNKWVIQYLCQCFAQTFVELAKSVQIGDVTIDGLSNPRAVYKFIPEPKTGYLYSSDYFSKLNE
jgi:hypothetical protein